MSFFLINDIRLNLPMGWVPFQLLYLGPFSNVRCIFLVPIDAKERAHLTEIIEDRHGRKSIIVTSQLPELDWYDAIGDTTVADAILDRIVHTAHRITLTGESVRKLKAFKGR